MNHLSYCLAAAQTWREKMKEARALTPSPSEQPTGHPGRPIAGLSWNEDTVLQDVKQAQDKPAREVCRAADFDLQGLWPFLYCLRLAKTLGPVADMRRGCSEVLEPKVWGLFPGAQGKIICSIRELASHPSQYTLQTCFNPASNGTDKTLRLSGLWNRNPSRQD